jgi:hypothetical protein
MAVQPQQPITSDTPAGNDTGTDPEVRTLEQTQSIPYVQDQELDDTVEIINVGDPELELAVPAAAPTVQAGAGSNDDSGQSDVATTPPAVNASGPDSKSPSGVRAIKPQPNILDRFANYTYSASVYMLTPQQFKLYQSDRRKSLNNYNLLFQSGGAANNVNGAVGAVAGLASSLGSQSKTADGRNPFFSEDFYIDSISVENLVPGKATATSHALTNLKFTVIEPANITLFDRLYRAVQDLSPVQNNKINYGAVNYLMVIRFYGYDSQGKPVTVGAADPKTGLTDASAVVEKFIPFRIREIKWSVASKLVSYEFDCTPVGQIAAASRRGTIPMDLEVTASTVGEILGGSGSYATLEASTANPGASTTPQQVSATDEQNDRELNRAASQAPPKATATPVKSVLKKGLIEAMNAHQQDLVKKGQYEVADQYEIVWAGVEAESIRDATVTKPGSKVDKDKVGMAPPASQNTSSVSDNKQSADTKTRSFGIASGTQMVQALDLIIRNSSYITNQSVTVITDVGDQSEPNPVSTGNKKQLKWFNVLMTATPLEYDNKRNDYAYKVVYTIVPYVLVDAISEYFPAPEYIGCHKRYPWWFTGENIAVLDYTETFNTYYNLTVSGDAAKGSALDDIKKKTTADARFLPVPFVQSQARSTESAQGANGKANELAANLAEYLYNPGDLANTKIRILGDPAWIQQGQTAGYVDPVLATTPGFGPDGTINFDASHVMFEVAWQRPEDYDIFTGLADPYARTSKILGGSRQPIQSRVYRAIRCLSEFRQGRFEQTIEGTLYTMPVPGVNTGASQSGTSPLPGAVEPQGRENTSDDPSRSGSTAVSSAYLDGDFEDVEVDDTLLSSANMSTNAQGPRLEVPFDDTEISEEVTVINVSDSDVQLLPAPPPDPVQSNGEVTVAGTDLTVETTTTTQRSTQYIAREA